MNTAIILAGGTGTRLGADIPKQYIEVKGKPIISYCLRKFEENLNIDSIVIVAAKDWQTYIIEQIKKEDIIKFTGFAEAGSSRQHSIVNGIKAIDATEGKIIIHDAARPNVSDQTISLCMSGLDEADGVMPVLPVKDTVYYSETGDQISSLLNRDKLFAGQAPESFNLEKYRRIHESLTETDLSLIRGSSEIAYNNGLKVKLIAGDEHNYKITTVADLEKFRAEIE